MSEKKRLLLHKRSVLFSLLGLLLLAGLGLAPGTAFAASTHPHHLAQPQDGITNTNNCSQTDTSYSVAIVTNGGWSVDCFYIADLLGNTYSEPVGLFNVTALYTNNYDLTFTWRDANNNPHTSYKPAYTFLAPGEAGMNLSGPIAEITSISLTWDLGNPSATCTPDDTSAWFATNVNASQPYYALCYPTPGTYSVHLYGVYAIETGVASTFVMITWTDYQNQQHTTALYNGAPQYDGTLLAVGDAGSGGFAGADRMAVITSITIA